MNDVAFAEPVDGTGSAETPQGEPPSIKAPEPARVPEPEWITRAADMGWGWARLAWERASRVPGSWFDTKKADAVVRLWPTWFKLTDDRFAGVPFNLAFWQEVIVRLLVGWKAPVETIDPRTGKPSFEHVRLFRRLDLWIPRKNGKTEFLAALSLLFWAIEGAWGGQGFCFARDEKQAKIVFDKMRVMLALNATLVGAIQAFAKSFWMAERRASFEVLSGKPDGKHGRSPTVVVGDEMHEWITTDLATNLRQGTGARLQPIELYASTAGLKSARVGYQLFEEGLAILDGRVDDPSTLVVMFAAGEDEDWRDEAVWRRVNPNLGLSPSIDFLRREAKWAAQSERAEAHFRRYHLNQWVEAISRWLPAKDWRACGKSGDWRERWENLRGRRCFAGIDLSSNKDVTALVFWFPPDDEDPITRVVCRFWIPDDNVEERSRRDRVGYDKWVASGALEATPGNTVDQNYLAAALKEGLSQFNVERIGYDRWNAQKLHTDLQNDGIAAELFKEVRQGMRTLGPISHHFERLVLKHEFDFGGHPVLEWMGRNVLVRSDHNGNFMPDKKRSREKIDGIVATLTAGSCSLEDVDDTVRTDANIGGML